MTQPPDTSRDDRDGAAKVPAKARRSARVVRRRLLHDVRAVGNVWERATSSPHLAVNGSRPTRAEGARKLPWPAFPPQDYLGQLTPEFQAMLARERADIELADCDFYHASTLADGTVIPGPWDLRGGEPNYLGNIDVAGDRVLELGPASGALTFYMEDEGAEVVGFDVGFDVCGDMLPMPGLELRKQQEDYVGVIVPVQNSWWYLHKNRASNAKVAYGNIYRLPGDFGSFDTALFGAILLHLRDPFLALQQAAERTTRRIVVTDALQDPSLNPDDNLLRFASAGFENLTIWWTLTPGTIQRMLRHLGFDRQTTTFSSYKHYLGHDMSRDPIDIPMFTVVAERSDRHP